MAFTLQNALVEAYKALGMMETSKATGGSTTTIVDSDRTTAISETEENQYRGGAVFVLHDAAGASAAPEGEMGKISAFACSTGTFTHEALTTAVAAGDIYGYTNSTIPLYMMIEHVNSALQYIGELRITDTTSITVAAGQTQYDVPVGLKRKILNVYQATSSDTDDYQWSKISNWDYLPSAGGSTGTLVIPNPVVGYAVRMDYHGVHPKLYAYNSVVNEALHPEYVTYAIAERALLWYNRRSRGNDEGMMQLENKVSQYFAELKVTHAPPKIPVANKLFIIGNPPYQEEA